MEINEIVREADIEVIPKLIKPYKYPVRKNSDLIGNKEFKQLIGFVDKKEYPPKVGSTFTLYSSPENGYLFGEIIIEVKEVYKLSIGLAIVGFNNTLNEAVYILVLSRQIN